MQSRRLSRRGLIMNKLFLFLIFIFSCGQPDIKFEKKSASGFSNEEKSENKTHEFFWIEDGEEKKVYVTPNTYVVFPSFKAPYMIEVHPNEFTLFLNSIEGQKISEVFSEDPSGVGGNRALPGGLIIEFSKNLNELEINDWLKKRNLSSIKQIGNSSRWILNSPSGIKTFEVLNSIKNDPELKTVIPNWWMRTVVRR